MAASPGTAEPLESSKAEHPEAVQPPPLPIDEAEPPPPLLGAAAAHEAISPKKSASPSPIPANLAVEVSPEVESSSSSSSLSPSPSASPPPQIMEASPSPSPSPGAQQPLSPPRAAPAAAARASTGFSVTEAVAMASQEAARPSPSPEPTDANLHNASTPPMEIGPGVSLPQQEPQPPSPGMPPPLCDYSEPVHPSPLCHPDECTGASPDAPVDEIVAGTSGKAAGPSSGESSEFTRSPQPHLPAESTHVCSNAAGKVLAVASEEGTPPAMEAIDGEGPLEIEAQRSLQEQETTTTSSRMEAEPCSPEMAPPGFEDCKSQWLPLSHPNPLVESTHTVVQVTATNAMGTTPDAATGSLSSPGLLPLLKRGTEGQTLPRSCSPTAEAAPSSPDMPPPGFENCKSSWLPLWTLQPIPETMNVLHDVAPTKPMEVGFVEKACSMLALERTDVEMDSERSLLPPLESGTGSSLQGPLPRSPSMQATPCSPDTAPPGFENLKFTQLQPPSLPLVQTAHVLRNSANNEAISVISEETQRLPALDAMDLDINANPVLSPPLGSKPGKSLPPEPPLLLSHVAQHTCSLGMVLLASENIESSELLPPALVLPLDRTPDILADAGTKKTVAMEGVCHPLPVAGAVEEANGSVLPPVKENGCEGQSPHLEAQPSSPAVDAAATSLETAPRSFENSESFQLISPCLVETIDPSTHASATMPVIVKSEKTSLPLSPLQATGTDMESAILQQLPSKSEERSLPQPEQHLSSPSVKDTTCSPEDAPPGYENFDSLDQLPPPPPLCMKFEIGQMVCGNCRQLVAYPRGAIHVQCFGCSKINLVLEEHQVGKVSCGQCDTLLMYPFGAPAVKCSNCLFVTEIGERNVRPRILMEQSVSPDPQEIVQQS